MITISYGYLLPQNPDQGDLFFPALEFDIQRIATHNHDGVNSAPLALHSQSLFDSDWVAAPIGGGLFRQLVTMPVGLEYDDVDIWFRLSTGEFVYPSVERVSANTYYVYTNDNSLTYVAHYR